MPNAETFLNTPPAVPKTSAADFLKQKQSAKSFLTAETPINRDEFNRLMSPLDEAEFDRLLPPLNAEPAPAWQRDTTAGGPQLRTAGAPGAGAALGRQIEEGNAPIVALPKFKINPDDSRTLAVGKEAANLIVGIPEFAETPLGIATLPAGGLIPKTLAMVFGATTLHDLGKTVLDTHKNWKKYTPAQRAAAVTDIAGDTVLAGLLAHGATRTTKERTEPNATGNENEPGSVQPQREPGKAGGETTGAGAGDSLQPTTRGGAPPKEEAPQPIEGLPTSGDQATLSHLSGEPPQALHPQLKADLDLLRNVMEDQHRELAGRAVAERRAAENQRLVTSSPTKSKMPHLGAPSEYTLLDAVKENGGLSAPPLDEALEAMSKGKTGAQVVAAWAGQGGEHDALGPILEDIHANTGTGNIAESRRLRGIYRKLFTGTKPGGADQTLEGIKAASEQGWIGEVPQDPSELYEKAWQHATATKPSVDPETVLLQKREAAFAKFDKTLNYHDQAVWSGNSKLADVRQSATGRNMFSPTEAGNALPMEWQEHLVSKYEFPEDTNREAQRAQNTPPERHRKEIQRLGNSARGNEENPTNWQEVTRKEQAEIVKAKEGTKITSRKTGNNTGAYGVDEIFYSNGKPFLKTSVDSARQKGRVLKYTGPTQGRIEGMGGPVRSAARVAAEQSSRTMRERAQGGEVATGKELAKALDEELTPEKSQSGLTSAATNKKVWFAGLKAAFNPMSLGEAAKETAGILRYTLGKQFGHEQQFEAAMGKMRSLFDRFTTPRNFRYEPDKALPPNWETQRAIDSGEEENLTPTERTFSAQMRRLTDQAIAEIQQFKPDILQDLYESWFPRYWVKQDGSPAEDLALRLLRAHRPWQGPKTFLKARTLALWEDALARGLKPRYDNPVDVVYAKLSEMWRFAGALEAHTMMKQRGIRRFRYIFERTPEGWVSADPDDPSTKVFAPPTVTIHEAYDAQIRSKTLAMFKALGVANERLARIKGGKWGLAYEQPEHVETQFGGADFVFWHEFGHIMDYRFPDLRKELELYPIHQKNGRTIWRAHGVKDVELRKLADERLPAGDTGERFYTSSKTGKKVKTRSAYSQYTRKTEEKMANIFDAYVRAPELFQKVAPNVWSALNRWLSKHPEVQGPLNDIRPSLKLGEATTQMDLAGPVLLGEWIMPPDAAQVLRNHLDRSVWGKIKGLSALKKIGGVMSNVRLISLFHGQMVSNDALASGLSLPLYDAMQAVATRNPKLLIRAASDLFLAPARPLMALRQGSRILRTIRGVEGSEPNTVTARILKALRGGEASDLDKLIAKYAMDANLRAGHMDHVDNASRRFKKAIFEATNAMKGINQSGLTSAATKGVAAPLWQAIYEAPMMIAHEMMRPVMEWFVPRMKYGLFAPMATRIISDNAGADEGTLHRLMGKAADSVEDRVGQVTYDNMFLSKAVRDSGQLGLQAFGWHATKERMLWGAASDYAKAGRALLKGKQPEITFRMAYLPAMVITHALIGGAIMYALTGTRPRTMLDYLFPQTGLTDQNGKPVRVAMADFMKDYLSEFEAAAQGPKAEAQLWERRLMPIWNTLADLYRNRDFWNARIFSEKRFDEPEWQHLWDNLKEAVGYTIKSNQPFSAKGAEKFTQDLGPNATKLQKSLAYAGPYFGYVPAPNAVTQSPAEARAAEIMRDNLPPMSQEQNQRSQLMAALVHDLRTGRITDKGILVARERQAGIDPNTRDGRMRIAELKKRVRWTPLQYQVSKLPLWQPGGADAMSVWDLMSDGEKRQTAKLYQEKITTVLKSGGMDKDTAQRLWQVIQPYTAPATQAAQPQTTGNSTLYSN